MMHLKNKTLPFLPFLITGLLSVTVGLYFRLHPLIFHVNHEAEEKATIYILAQVKKSIDQKIDQQYPDLIPEQRDIIRKQLFDGYLRKENKSVRENINILTEKFRKDASAPKETPFLLESDSYFYYGLTERIANTGKISDRIKGSKFYYDLMMAPDGFWSPLNLHPTVGFWIYKILHWINPHIELMFAVAFTPLVITALSIIPFLYICRLLSCGPISCFLGSVFFILAPIFVKRSTFGWYDNDPYNILFPLLILSGLFRGLSQIQFQAPSDAETSGRKKDNPRSLTNIVALSFTALCLLLYSLFWQGWVFTFGLIVGSGFLIIATNGIFSKPKTAFKPLLFFFSGILLLSFLGISFLFGPKDFFVLFQEGWTALKNFLQPQLSPWPDIYISVGELHRTPFKDLVQQTGGLFFFIVSLFGMIISSIQAITKPKQPFPALIIVIGLFYLLSLVLSLGAQRFVLFCVIPFCLSFTLGIDFLFSRLQSWVQFLFAQKIKLRKILASLITVLFLCSIIVPIYNIHKTIPTLLNNIYNSTWDSTLQRIKAQTPEDSIINTWWPPGHFIKAMAHRRVTFDGGTINFPQAYWMANVFLSPTEKEALGILRMLNNSANRASEFLQQQGLKLSEVVRILKDLTKTDEISARILANKLLNDNKKAETLIQMTHHTPPPSYILIYNEFVENNLQLPFIGRWNFKAIEAINKNPALLKKIPKPNSKAYIDFLWTLVGGQLKYSGVLSQVSRQNDVVLFDQNIQINLSDKTCLINSKKFGKGKPSSVFYLDGDNIHEQKNDGHSLPYSALLLQDKERFNVVLLDRDLAQSLLIQLYFFKGKGFKYIQPFLDESDLTGRTHIQVYRVDWDKLQQDEEQNNKR